MFQNLKSNVTINGNDTKFINNSANSDTMGVGVVLATSAERHKVELNASASLPNHGAETEVAQRLLVGIASFDVSVGGGDIQRPAVVEVVAEKDFASEVDFTKQALFVQVALVVHATATNADVVLVQEVLCRTAECNGEHQ